MTRAESVSHGAPFEPSTPGGLPTFLVIGAMRSGTTWLARCLDDHPAVFMAARKELHYFDVFPDKGLDWYRRQFEGSIHAAAVGEATQGYMYDPLAISRIAGVLPEVRLIAILRNPVDRAYSHFWLNRSQGQESLTFKEALEAEPERLRSDRRSRFRYSYVDRGRYATQLRYVLERLPRSSLHVLVFEEFRDAPEREYETICRFLEIDHDVRPVSFENQVNAYQEFRSLKARRLASRVPREGFMPKVARGILGRLNRRRSSYPPMSKELRQGLGEVFDSEIEGLERLLGRDLSEWSR